MTVFSALFSQYTFFNLWTNCGKKVSMEYAKHKSFFIKRSFFLLRRTLQRWSEGKQGLADQPSFSRILTTYHTSWNSFCILRQGRQKINTKIVKSDYLITPTLGTFPSEPPTFLSRDGPFPTRNTVVAARGLPFSRHHEESRMAALHTFGFWEGLSQNRRHVKDNMEKMCYVHLGHIGFIGLPVLLLILDSYWSQEKG